MSPGTAAIRRKLPPKRSALFRPKYLLFAVIAAAFFYVMWIDERFFLDSGDPAWQHFGPLKLWLFPYALPPLADCCRGRSSFRTASRRATRSFTV
jgi:hypothetical protein